MGQFLKSLSLAFAMIAIGLLAINDIIPEGAAQWAPLALLVLFPSAWLRSGKACNLGKRATR